MWKHRTTLISRTTERTVGPMNTQYRKLNIPRKKGYISSWTPNDGYLSSSLRQKNPPNLTLPVSTCSQHKNISSHQYSHYASHRCSSRSPSHHHLCIPLPTPLVELHASQSWPILPPSLRARHPNRSRARHGLRRRVLHREAHRNLTMSRWRWLRVPNQCHSNQY